VPGSRTEGRFHPRCDSSAVRGTYWLVADRCDGTFTGSRGVVDVFDFRLNRVFRVPQSRTHLAR
jgi:hypothetical protein